MIQSSEKSHREGGPQENGLELSSLALKAEIDQIVAAETKLNQILPTEVGLIEINQPNESTETYDEKNRRV